MNRALVLFHSYQEEHKWAENAMRDEARGLTRPLRILEAGCGNRWFADLSDVSYRLTGVDIDRVALDIRLKSFNDLHEVVHGDLFSVELEADFYDVIYNAFVLEHVRDPERLLVRFCRWLRPGGLLILKIPDRDSVKGFVTAHTPHWLHVAYYRYYKKSENAGKPGHMPYPTPFDRVVSRSGIHLASKRLGFEIVEERGRSTLVDDSSALFQGTLKALGAASMARLHSDHSDLSFLLRKVCKTPGG